MPIDTIQKILCDISNIVGAKYVLSATDMMAEYLEERRGNYAGEAEAVVLPANSTEVASIVKICADRHIPIVPQVVTPACAAVQFQSAVRSYSTLSV